MLNLINESDKINVGLSNFSGAEEHFPTSKAAYKVWQESLAYLQEHTEIALSGRVLAPIHKNPAAHKSGLRKFSIIMLISVEI
jgi:hypothetical protein